MLTLQTLHLLQAPPLSTSIIELNTLHPFRHQSLNWIPSKQHSQSKFSATSAQLLTFLQIMPLHLLWTYLWHPTSHTYDRVGTNSFFTHTAWILSSVLNLFLTDLCFLSIHSQTLSFHVIPSPFQQRFLCFGNQNKAVCIQNSIGKLSLNSHDKASSTLHYIILFHMPLHLKWPVVLQQNYTWHVVYASVNRRVLVIYFEIHQACIMKFTSNIAICTIISAGND